MGIEEPCVKLASGHCMPKIGLGTFDANGEVMRKTLRVALETGYRAIDTACLYDNERDIGQELQDWIQRGVFNREDIFVTSKLPLFSNRPEGVFRNCRNTLKKLNLKYLDLYLIHHPFSLMNKTGEDLDSVDLSNIEDCKRIDNSTDFILVWKTMEKLVDEGLVKSIGLSNFNEEQVERVAKVARVPVSNLQVEAHVYMQQTPLLNVCKKHNIVMTGYGPLGAPYRDVKTDEFPLLIKHPEILRIAKSHNKSAGQILLKFLLQIDILIVPKSATPSRIKENFELLDFEITDSEMEILKKKDRGEDGRVLNFVDLFPGCITHKDYPFRKPAH